MEHWRKGLGLGICRNEATRQGASSQSGEMADDVEFHAHVRLVVMLGNKFFMSRNGCGSGQGCLPLLFVFISHCVGKGKFDTDEQQFPFLEIKNRFYKKQ